MSSLNISSVSSLLNPWVATRPQSATAQSYVDQATSVINKYVPHVAKAFDGWIHMIVGFAAMTWGAIGAHFLKENSYLL